MSQQPDILIILTDAMQAESLAAGHPCRTPNLDALRSRGVSFENAHTVCPTCSPARASLMTGLLPHNHGVLEVEHGRDPDQCVLRTDRPHFAQRLSDAGYRTGYFGKWHIERSNRVEQFGWQESIVKGAEHLTGLGRGDHGPSTCQLDPDLTGYVDGHPGYNRTLHWGVTDTPIDDRYPGITVNDASRYLERVTADPSPWCCCVSFSEPNEALIVGRDTWESYDPDAIPLPANFFDDMADRPNMYRREQEIGRPLPEEVWRNARASYFGRITEIDTMVGRLLNQLDQAGELDDTIIVFLSDNGAEAVTTERLLSMMRPTAGQAGAISVAGGVLAIPVQRRPHQAERAPEHGRQQQPAVQPAAALQPLPLQHGQGGVPASAHAHPHQPPA